MSARNTKVELRLPPGARATGDRDGESGPLGLSRGHGVALWRQIANAIETDIRTGRLQAGDRLPTEAAMAAGYGVNRHTLRHALAELSRKGLVTATRRLGTFVSDARIAYPISSRTRFSEIVSQAGREPGGRMVDSRLIDPPPEIAQRLRIARRAQVVELTHVRDANGLPICIATSWFPADRLPRIAELFGRTGSITRALSMLGIKDYRRRWTSISARLPDSSERGYLEIGQDAILLVTETLNVDTDGEPIQAASTRFVADRVELVIESG